MEAVVVDSTANTIVVEDLTGDLFEALGPEGRPIADFVPSRGSTGASLRSVSLRSIFAFNDSKQANAPTYQTHGRPKGANPQNACHFAERTSAPSFASSQTTFTDVDADDNGGGFASWMIGALLVPDVNIGAPLIITGATATTLTVAGDVETVRWTVERAELCGAGSSGVAANGSQYIVYAAPFTDPVRGTWQTDLHRRGTRYLWAGYRYQPPQMGFWVDPPGAPVLGVYGAATGANRLGQYYCWNRNYDINTGRWTTPDPVATPWWNLGDYCHAQPTRLHDPTGNAAAAAVGGAVAAALKSLGIHTAKCLAVAAGMATATAIVVNIVSAPGAMDPCELACIAGIMAFATCILPWGSGIVVGAIIDVMLGHPVESFCKDLCSKLRASGTHAPTPSSSGGNGTAAWRPRRDKWGVSDGETACVTPEEVEDLRRMEEEEKERRREEDRKNGITRDEDGREIGRKDQQA